MGPGRASGLPSHRAPIMGRSSLYIRIRIPYSGIEGRQPLKFPDGLRHDRLAGAGAGGMGFVAAMARMVISPPQGQPHAARPSELELARIRHAGRLLAAYSDMLERAEVTPTVTLNAKVCETYPQVVAGLHGPRMGTQRPRLRPGSHAQARRPEGRIDKSMDDHREILGQAPRGWFGPGLTQTFDTLDHLSEPASNISATGRSTTSR